MSGLLSVTLGARAGAQAAAFGLCFAAGIFAGIFALLYFRRASIAERALCDLFATLAIAVGAILCAEFFLGGKPEAYGVIAYLCGSAVIPLLYRAIKKRASAKKDRQKQKDTK